MKKILALAAVAALTAGVSAYAANPFSDVSTDDWAYQAVSDLSDQGVVEGYPDGTFKGERNMTRYELAQIIARLMAKEDQLNAQQQATLDKLAGEYADELANLGVRVSNLEKKVGNIAWSGNARMRFNQDYDAKGKANDNWNGRIKLIAHANVNDDTYVEGRFVSVMDFKDDKSANTEMDEIIVHHQFGDKVGVTLGRQDLYIGQSGIYYDDEFDGAIATVGADQLALDLGYGRFDAQKYAKVNDNKPEAFLARLHGADGILSYELNYIDYAADKNKVWGAGLTVNATSDIDVFGDYFQNTDAAGDPAMWTAGVSYGHTNLAKPGTFKVGAQYISAEKNAFLGGTTYNLSSPLDILADKENENNAKVTKSKFWLASADVVLQKNVYLHAEYAFDVDTEGTTTDYDDLYMASINYKF